MNMISNPKWTQLLLYICSQCWLDICDCQLSIHLLFNPPAWQRNEMESHEPISLQSTSKLWRVFYFILSFVSVFYLKSYWIMCTGFDLIPPIILAYMNSLSNYIANGYVSFSLWIYYGYLADFKWSWITLLICYQHLFNKHYTPIYCFTMVPWEGYISWNYILEPASYMPSATVVLWLFSWVNIFWNNMMDLWEFAATPGFKGRDKKPAMVWVTTILQFL